MVSFKSFRKGLCKPFDMAIRKEICASGMVAENSTQQKSQFELSLSNILLLSAAALLTWIG